MRPGQTVPGKKSMFHGSRDLPESPGSLGLPISVEVGEVIRAGPCAGTRRAQTHKFGIGATCPHAHDAVVGYLALDHFDGQATHHLPSSRARIGAPAREEDVDCRERP